MNINGAKLFEFLLIFAIFCTILTGTPAAHIPEDNAIIADYSAYVQEGTEQFRDLVENSKCWAQRRGLILRTEEHVDKSDVAEIAPYTLFPTNIPRDVYRKVMAVHQAMMLLYYRVSQNFKFVKAVTGRSDLHMEHWEEHLKQEAKQPIVMFFARSDYVLHETRLANGEMHYELKLIDMSSGNIAMAGLSQKASKLHRRILSEIGKEVPKGALPVNMPAATLAQGLIYAWKLFNDPEAIIIVVEMPNQANKLHYDQRQVDWEVEQMTGGEIKIVYISYEQCAEKCQLDPEDNSLSLDGQKVAVVYQRTILTPGSRSETYWDIYQKIHSSSAIKCPTLGTTVASSKKIQQALMRPGMLERFFPDTKDADKIATIRATFPRQWYLKNIRDEKTGAAVKDAILHPDNYVLKHVHDGEEQEYHGAEVASKIIALKPDKHLAEYTLMERIRPMSGKTYIVKPWKQPELLDTVTELGAYGFFIADKSKNVVRKSITSGHLMRARWAKSPADNDAPGDTSAWDSPFLV